jgi:hypothetical protein
MDSLVEFFLHLPASQNFLSPAVICLKTTSLFPRSLTLSRAGALIMANERRTGGINESPGSHDTEKALPTMSCSVEVEGLRSRWYYCFLEGIKRKEEKKKDCQNLSSA